MILLPLFIKSLRDKVRSIFSWSLGIIAIVTLQLSVYPTIRDSATEMGNIAEAFPEAFQKMFRMQDYTSEVGYLSTELFSAALPLIFLAVAMSWGARLTTEEEDEGTADLLFTLPFSRFQYVTTRFVAALMVLLIISTSLFITLAIGTRLLDFSLALSTFFAGMWALFLLGIVFASGAAFIGAVSGRRSAALGTAITLAIGFFVLYSLAPLVSSIDATMPFNPLQWTIGTQPLMNGVDWGYSLIALGLSATFVAGTYIFFQRRDIKA
jgi:ABC-2 type transport system permease protein